MKLAQLQLDRVCRVKLVESYKILWRLRDHTMAEPNVSRYSESLINFVVLLTHSVLVLLPVTFILQCYFIWCFSPNKFVNFLLVSVVEPIDVDS